MSFIAKNPLTAPIISKQPSSPPIGARGLFASEDGWYDVNSNGVTEKIATNTSLAGKVDKVNGKGLSTKDYTADEKEKLASLSNYDDTKVKSDISSLESRKVDKVSGKGLSTEDYTTAEKEKLSGLSNYDDTKVKSDIINLATEISDISSKLNGKIDKSAITTVVNNESTDEEIPSAKAVYDAGEALFNILEPRITTTEININQINEAIATKTDTAIPETLTANVIYDLGEQTSLALNLPSGKLGDFIQVDFLSTATPTTLTITATPGLSDYDLIPEANTIYSLYFNWIRLDATTYGWGFGYAEYTRTVTE